MKKVDIKEFLMDISSKALSPAVTDEYLKNCGYTQEEIDQALNHKWIIPKFSKSEIKKAFPLDLEGFFNILV